MSQPNLIPSAKFARLWLDPRLTKSEVAARAGFSVRQSAKRRAQSLGLPSRPIESPGRKRRVTDEALFRSMWLAGVAGADMARHFGVTHTTIRNTRARISGLDGRPRGWRGEITLQEFWEMRLQND